MVVCSGNAFYLIVGGVALEDTSEYIHLSWFSKKLIVKKPETAIGAESSDFTSIHI